MLLSETFLQGEKKIRRKSLIGAPPILSVKFFGLPFLLKFQSVHLRLVWISETKTFDGKSLKCPFHFFYIKCFDILFYFEKVKDSPRKKISNIRKIFDKSSRYPIYFIHKIFRDGNFCKYRSVLR